MYVGLVVREEESWHQPAHEQSKGAISRSAVARTEREQHVVAIWRNRDGCRWAVVADTCVDGDRLPTFAIDAVLWRGPSVLKSSS